jgi:hypothetical protein
MQVSPRRRTAAPQIANCATHARQRFVANAIAVGERRDL